MRTKKKFENGLKPTPKKTTQKEARGIFDWIWLVVSAGGIEAFLIAKSVKARHKSRSVLVGDHGIGSMYAIQCNVWGWLYRLGALLDRIGMDVALVWAWKG